MGKIPGKGSVVTGANPRHSPAFISLNFCLSSSGVRRYWSRPSFQQIFSSTTRSPPTSQSPLSITICELHVHYQNGKKPPLPFPSLLRRHGSACGAILISLSVCCRSKLPPKNGKAPGTAPPHPAVCCAPPCSPGTRNYSTALLPPQPLLLQSLPTVSSTLVMATPLSSTHHSIQRWKCYFPPGALLWECVAPQP